MNSLNNQENLLPDGNKVHLSAETTNRPAMPPLAEPPDRFRVERYTLERKAEWNAFLLKGKNTTFFFQRDYMDYHADRFEDYSLMIYCGEELCAMLPANLETPQRVVSHGGLTFGGFIVERSASLVEILELFQAALKYLHEHGILFLEHRRIPPFYNTLPSEELDYAIFLLDAKLIRRDCALVINQQDPLPFRKGRKSEISKAKRFGVTVQEERDYAVFWNQVLIPRLMARYGVKPVHTLEQITLLAERFPENIRQFNAYHEGQVVAGATIYETPTVAHCQYLGVTEQGQKVGALDFLCGWLIRERYAQKKFFDFGICNELQGRAINHGMMDWKEAFGGLTYCHNFYEITCSRHARLETVSNHITPSINKLKSTLLVTTVGSGAGYFLVESALQLGVQTVIAGDTNPAELVYASALVRKYFTLPEAVDPRFAEHMVGLLRENAVKFWIPILDEEIIAAAKIREAHPDLPTFIQAPSAQTAELCFDKLKIAEWLGKNALPTPFTQPIETATWRTEGWFIKPRFGRGSVGTMFCQNEEQFNAVRHESSPLLVQVPAFQPEVTVDAYAPLRGGSLRAICRQRLETKSGVCTKALVYYDQQLEQMSQKLADGLGLRGGFCFQVMADQQGRWVITDINPRLGAGTALSAAVGFDVGSALICDLLEIPYLPYLQQIHSPRHVIRAYREYVTH